jgi:hypothetical protein
MHKDYRHKITIRRDSPAKNETVGEYAVNASFLQDPLTRIL